MKIIETEVKTLNYRVVDKNNGKIILETDDPTSIVDFVNNYVKTYYDIVRQYNNPNLLENDRNLHRLEFKKFVRTEIDYDVNNNGVTRWYSTRPYPRIRNVYEFKYCYGFYVETELGDLVDPRDIPVNYNSHRNFSEHEEKLEELINFNLTKRKNNRNKIKDSYQTRYSRYSGWGYSLHSGNRSIRTLQARKYVDNVCRDDGEPEFRGKRRNLPNSWDDIQSCIHNTRKSWKHNSKRRKQWKVKPST